MEMGPRLRKLTLTAHVTTSVGWLGAVVGFLALAVAGLTSRDAQTVRAAYLSMDLTARVVIVPLALASLLTGLVSSLGTAWGLFRYYWVLVKFLLIVFAAIILLLKLQPISQVASLAAERALSSDDLRDVRTSLVAHAAGGLLVLLAATVLGVYKPWGTTRYGRRRRHEESGETSVELNRGRDTGTPRWVYVFALVALVLVLVFVLLHLTGHAPVGH